MKLSIAIITYNRKKELLRALKSCDERLRNYIHDYSYEYVIWDNYSSDGSEEYIKSNFQKTNLKYIYSRENLGVSGGRNKVFEKCSGEYVFFLDDDAVIASKDFFTQMLLYMDENQNIVALSPDIQEPESGTDLNSRYTYQMGNYSLILSFCGCAHVLRREFFNQIGSLYPDKLKFGSEELYASIIAHANNKYVVEYKKIKVEHFPSVINRHEGNERKFEFIFNQYLIKTYLYPKSVILISFSCYMLHRLKNGFCGKKWSLVAKELKKERFQSEYISRIAFKEWTKIIRKFSWKATL